MPQKAHPGCTIFAKILLMSVRILIAFVTILLFACNESAKPKAAARVNSTNTPAFDTAVGKALARYYELTEKFVNWDSAGVNASAAQLHEQLNAVPVSERKDSVASREFSKTVASLDSLLTAKTLAGKRGFLNTLTENYFSFLRASKYNVSEVYLNVCPMAFRNEDSAGVWLSDVDTISNPYYGVRHPYYKRGMAECGSNQAKLGVN